MKPSIKKSLYSCALLIFCGLICLANFIIFKDIRYFLPYLAPTVKNVSFELIQPEWANKETVKQKIDLLFENDKYVLIEASLEYPIKGKANIV